MDPIANMLVAINNASKSGKNVTCVPYSKIKLAIAQTLLKYNFLSGVRVLEASDKHSTIELSLKYKDGQQPAISKLRRVSKPGRRIYIKADDITKPRGGLGITIVSTPKGIMTGYQAKKARLGGEVLCEVLS